MCAFPNLGLPNISSFYTRARFRGLNNLYTNCNCLFYYILSDIVNSKLGMPRPQIGQSISQQGFFSSRDSLSVIPGCVSHPLHSYSATTSDMDLSRKNESTSKLKPGEQPLLGTWNPSIIAPRESIVHPTVMSASTNYLASNNSNGVNTNVERYGFTAIKKSLRNTA